MTVTTWEDTARNELSEPRWVAEVFERDSDEDPIRTFCWFAKEREAQEAAWDWIEAEAAFREACRETNADFRNSK